MIKNVVFDLGQVLYRFEPMHLVSPYVKNEEDKKLLATVLFDRLYWDRLDAGTIEDEEVVTLACSRLPSHLHEPCRMAYKGWIYNMPEVEGMREVVTRVKKMGKKVYLLSNVSKYFEAHSDEFSIFENFDKCLFSASLGYTKPNKEIYLSLLDLTDSKGEETLFIDDSEANVNGARAVGIHAYHFDGDVSALSRYLDRVL